MKPHRNISIWLLLALTYSGLLVAGSLFPFRLWQTPHALNLSFLWASWPKSVTRTDLLTNLFIYVPFGLLVARTLSRRHMSLSSWLLVCAVGALFSTAMETAQLMIRYRVASNLDITANTLGTALGAAMAPVLTSHSRLMAWLVVVRQRWFRRGWLINIGLILALLWLIAQFSLQAPALVAGGLRHGFKPFWNDPTLQQLDLRVTLIFSLEIMCIGLFGGLLLRPERCTPTSIAVITVGAMLLKVAAAALLVKIAILPRLMSWELLLGMGGGVLLAILPVAWRHQPPAAPWVAGALGALGLAKLLRGLPFITATGLTPDLATQPEVLLNITSVGYLIAEVWPYLALGCTLALIEEDAVKR